MKREKNCFSSWWAKLTTGSSPRLFIYVVSCIIAYNTVDIWNILSHWPIKLQHKLFSPWKVHVRMHESLVYETEFNWRVSSPSTVQTIILSIPGEANTWWTTMGLLQEDNFRPLILILILQTQTIIYNI